MCSARVRVCTCAGQIASHSLQAMQRSSPEGYLVKNHNVDIVAHTAQRTPNIIHPVKFKIRLILKLAELR